MEPDELIFDEDDCWATPREAPLDVGDVFVPIGLPLLDEEYELHVLEERGWFFVRVLPVFALVVGRFEEFAVVVPITTADGVADAERFSTLVESGATASHWATLPPLGDAWGEEAIAVLFQPATLPVAHLEAPPVEHLAGMTPRARTQLQTRFARVWVS